MPNEQASTDLEPLSVKQAAKALQRSERSVRRYLQEGKLAAEKVPWGAGHKWLIDAASVADLARRLQGESAGGGRAGGEGLRAQVAALQVLVEELRAEVATLSALREDWQKALPEPDRQPQAAVPGGLRDRVRRSWRVLRGRAEE